MDQSSVSKKIMKLGFAVSIIFAVSCILFGTLLWIPEWMANQYAFCSVKDWASQVTANRGILVNLLGGLAVAITIYFTYRNFKVSQQNLRVAEANTALAQDKLTTEALSKAIEQLGNVELSVRLGGVYTLARIARNSKSDYFPIMQILTGYLRYKYQHPQSQGKLGSTSPGSSNCPVEVQTILTIIGERYFPNTDGYYLDLSYTNIPDAWLPGADLRNIYFWSAKLNRWNLSSANLRDADFKDAVLDECEFSDADLSGANFEQVSMFSPKGLTKQQLDAAINVDPTLYHLL